MLKKMVFILSVITFLSGTSFLTYSYSIDPRYAPETPSTEEFMAVITRPQGVSETTFRDTFLLCGVNFKSKLRFEALVFNTDKGLYEPATMSHGLHIWDMENPGVFAEQLILEKKGVNNIRIAAYDNDVEDFVLGENLQITNYAITLMEKEDHVYFGAGFSRISRMLSQIFGS